MPSKVSRSKISAGLSTSARPSLISSRAGMIQCLAWLPGRHLLARRLGEVLHCAVEPGGAHRRVRHISSRACRGSRAGRDTIARTAPGRISRCDRAAVRPLPEMPGQQMPGQPWPFTPLFVWREPSPDRTMVKRQSGDTGMTTPPPNILSAQFGAVVICERLCGRTMPIRPHVLKACCLALIAIS